MRNAYRAPSRSANEDFAAVIGCWTTRACVVTALRFCCERSFLQGIGHGLACFLARLTKLGALHPVRTNAKGTAIV